MPASTATTLDPAVEDVRALDVKSAETPGSAPSLAQQTADVAVTPASEDAQQAGSSEIAAAKEAPTSSAQEAEKGQERDREQERERDREERRRLRELERERERPRENDRTSDHDRKRELCKDFANGICFRSNCRFYHDPKFAKGSSSRESDRDRGRDRDRRDRDSRSDSKRRDDEDSSRKRLALHCQIIEIPRGNAPSGSAAIRLPKDI